MGARTLTGACNQGDLPLVRKFIAEGHDVNELRSRGWFPLGGAADGGYVQIARVLLDNGAKLEHTSEYGWTPLYIAANRGHLGMVRFFLKCGAKTNRRCKTQEYGNSVGGDTPLHTAADRGRYGIVRALLKAGADPNSLNEQGNTPMDCVLWNRQNLCYSARVLRLLAMYGGQAKNTKSMRSVYGDPK